MTGDSFIDSLLNNVSFTESNLNYANFAMANMENILLDNTILRNSNFQENKFKNIVLKNANLTQAQFFKSSLNGIDFSDSLIDGIVVSIEDLKGAIINEFQAVDLIGLIGVKIK